jgi:molybdopterin molybdotransferase
MTDCPSTNLLTVDEALAQLQQAACQRVPHIEEIALTEALGRVLAQDIVATVDVPPQANSAMDGYALNIEHSQPENIVSQRIAAGSQPVALQQGTVARIFTGAVIPQGANAVVMQENCQLLADGRVQILQWPKEQENIRPQGQDIQQGQCILQQGTKLTPAALGLLATIGLGGVKVYQRLKVMYFSTGNELVEANQDLAVGQIYNSNGVLLHNLLQQAGFVAINGGVIADNFDDTVNALRLAAQQADVVMTTGGVSVGEEDYVKAALAQIGHLDLWKIAIKPGKPLAFGEIAQTPFIGLPGNPQSVFVTFSILARVFLAYRQGQREDVIAKAIPVKCDFSMHKVQSRREYVRVRLVTTEQGLVLQKHNNQSSGVLSSAVWADGFALIEAHQRVNQGDLVPFQPF